VPWIFSYGSLQQPAVQRAQFGRQLDGRRDVLRGFTQESLRRGGRILANAVRTTAPAQVEGMAFEVTDAELAAADAYEHADAYTRIPAVLASGLEAWIYVDAATYEASPAPS
jgi:hypothetical protein